MNKSLFLLLVIVFVAAIFISAGYIIFNKSDFNVPSATSSTPVSVSKESLKPEKISEKETAPRENIILKVVNQSEALAPVAGPATSTENQLVYSSTASKYIAETSIDIQSIVLVRCLFRTQYFASSSQPWGEEGYNVGTGIIVSPTGSILTAMHVLEIPKDLLNDPAGRIWTRKKCDAVITDAEQSAIPAIGLWGQKEDSRFKEVEIIFEPSNSEYRGSSGLDFAVLKIKEAENLHFTSVTPELIRFEQKNPILIIGYPGRESASPQKLERFDAEFLELSFYSESLCGEAVVPCGLRYFVRRYPFDYAKDFWKPTEYGIVTPYFRGGFSGAPAFYRGNFIGIVTHGISGENSRSGWDEVAVLVSHDIALALEGR